jgi:hypothetical protein
MSLEGDAAMKAGNLTAQMACPACEEPLTIPLTLRMTDRATASLTFNTLAVQEHLKTHATDENDTEEALGERP